MALNIQYKKVVTGQYGNKDNITEVVKKVVHTELDGYKVEKPIKKLKVKSVKKVVNQPVYDIAVNNNQNFFADNLLVHNCFEISFKPVTEDGRYGVQFCNLSEINGAKIKNLEDWKQAVESATIIGTLQAGYTDFPYLSKTCEELTKEEALLGVSLTGWFDNPDLLLNEQNQYVMAKLVNKINKEWSAKININQSARNTCVKPSGTASLFLGSSSGIHPHHAHRYFRRVQVNKLDNVYNYFKVFNPHATEESVWSATKSDDVVTFPLNVPENAIVKSDLSAIEHLNYIRKTQENWVNAGSTEVNKKPVSHNVSCFSGDTKFISNKGLISFQEALEENNLKVLNQEGKFVDATIKSFGVQPIVKLTLGVGSGKGIRKISFETTENHVWIVKNKKNTSLSAKYSQVKTKDLTIGHQFPFIVNSNSIGYDHVGYLHGMVFGDGSLHKNNNKCQIYLCGEKRELASMFKTHASSIIERDDLNQTRIYGLPNFWKNFPSVKDVTPEYIRAFISGWFSVDGHISKDSKCYTLCNIDIDNLDWIKTYASIGGLTVSSHILTHKTNDEAYTKKDKFYTLSFIKSSLDENFFLLNKKKERFLSSVAIQSPKRWSFISMEKLNIEKEVFCAVVPNDEVFTLEGNILTHNCTVEVGDEEEWSQVIDYLYENRQYFSAVSLLPKVGDTLYKQAPLQRVYPEDETKWKELTDNWKSIDWEYFNESEDFTKLAEQLACAGGNCELPWEKTS